MVGCHLYGVLYFFCFIIHILLIYSLRSLARKFSVSDRGFHHIWLHFIIDRSHIRFSISIFFSLESKDPIGWSSSATDAFSVKLYCKIHLPDTGQWMCWRFKWYFHSPIRVNVNFVYISISIWSIVRSSDHRTPRRTWKLWRDCKEGSPGCCLFSNVLAMRRGWIN